MSSIFIYAFLTSFVALMIIIYLSHKYSIFIDDAGEEKPQNYHTDSTPRAGGIGIIFGMYLLMFFPLGFKFIIPLTLAFISGIFEDFHNSLSPKLRLVLQILAAFSAIWFTHSVITYLGLGISIPYWLGVLFSAFAIVGMMNAINIIDGFNGLASGIILLILLSFAMISYKQDDMEILTIILTTAGATLGFFILNFPKGKIFLGDGGAYLLGFIVAIIGIFLASKYESVSPWYILAVFIYPVWEVLFSIFRKLRSGYSPMEPDSYHIHMLIYKHVTRNNPLTAMLILMSVGPFILIATLYHANSIANVSTILLFILCYSYVYRYLFQKEKLD